MFVCTLQQPVVFRTELKLVGGFGLGRRADHSTAANMPRGATARSSSTIDWGPVPHLMVALFLLYTTPLRGSRAQSVNDVVITCLASDTGKSNEQLRLLMERDYYMTATEVSVSWLCVEEEAACGCYSSGG